MSAVVERAGDCVWIRAAVLEAGHTVSVVILGLVAEAGRKERRLTWCGKGQGHCEGDWTHERVRGQR